jgi:peptide/nickel transport system substrate-binding protein
MKPKPVSRFIVFFFHVGLWAWIFMLATPAGASETLVYGHQSKIDTLDHYKTSSSISWTLGYLMWDSLVERDPKTNKIVPGAAKSWKIINDTTWEFTLHDGIKFHNGNPLNSEAVRFTILEGILNPERKSTKAGHFKWVDRIEVVDNLTFRIITKSPYALVLDRLYNVFIYDPISTKANGFESLSETPMGSGPYKFAKSIRDSELVMTRNPQYWKKGVAQIENIKIRIIPEPSTRLAELLNGGIHFTTTLPNDMIEVLRKSDKVEPLIADTAEINFWQFDSVGRASRTPLTDKRVRQAIWHAIDRQTIVKTVLRDLGTVVDSPVNPLMFGFDPTVKGYEYNPQKAKALLKEAGFENGFEIDLWQYVNHQNYPNQAAMGYLNKVGIKVNLKDYTGNIGQMVTLRNAGKITGIGNFEWITAILDADVTLSGWFAPGPTNYSEDAEIVKWLEEAGSTLDMDKRRAVFAKIQKKVVDEAYWMPFYSIKELAGQSKDLDVEMVAGQIPWFKGAYWKK